MGNVSCYPNCSIVIVCSWVRISLHSESQFPRLQALKFPGVVAVGGIPNYNVVTICDVISDTFFNYNVPVSSCPLI